MPISPNREATATEILDRRSSQATGYIADPAADPIIPDLPIQRLRSLLGQFGDPHLTTPFVHVAGSNGKTSTCHFIASICRAAGYNAGLYSSPHLHSYRERIGISGASILADAFERLIGQLDLAASAIESNWPDLGAFSAFDLLTAAAFVWFADQDCQIAVIEVGLGGRYDPTNVISPVLSVITPIELEHTEFLGTDIASIAENKAGIIKTGIPVVSTRQQHAAQVVIERTAAELGSAVLLQERDWRIVGQHNAFDLTDTSGTVTCILDPPGGVSQRNNAGTAACAARHLQGIALIIDDVSIREGIAATTIPGRFERRTIEGIEYVLDGAHTSDAMRQLVNSVRSTASSAPVVFGVLGDKDIDALLTELTRFADPLIIVQLSARRSLSADSIESQALAFDVPCLRASSVETGLHLATSIARNREVPVVVTGSLKTVAEAREALNLAEES